jgi:outer membrane protein OmpA-like peptidoglycan-associated protein
MKNIFLSLIIVLVSVLLPQTVNAQTSKEKWNIASWEPGLGMVFRHKEQFSAVRLAMGSRNLMIKNRVGVYYILEYRGGIKFQEDGTNFYFRDLLGLNYSINKSFSIHGGMGVFRKGILLNGEERGGEFYLNKLQFGRLRHAIGVTFRIPEYPISIDLGYSSWVGPTATFGYIIPMKQKKLGNAPLKSIPVYDVPVIVETTPEKEVIVVTPTIDTNTSKPVIVEVIPEPVKIAVPIDTIVTQPVLAKTKPAEIDTVVTQPVLVESKPAVIDTIVTQPVLVESKPAVIEPVVIPAETVVGVDIAALAKQSTTYYPFNVDTLDYVNADKLSQLIEYLNTHKNAKVTIFGNADRMGSESYNLTLSGSRAKNVRSYLVKNGVEFYRIKTVAYGEVKAKGETEEERALNRCVEFIIQTK